MAALNNDKVLSILEVRYVNEYLTHMALTGYGDAYDRVVMPGDTAGKAIRILRAAKAHPSQIRRIAAQILTTNHNTVGLVY